MLVCFPIEIFEREIDTRLFLTSIILNMGGEVIIGDMRNPVFGKINNAIVLMSHGFAETSASIIKRIKKNDNYLIFHDEEGLIRKSDRHYKEQRVGKSAIKYGDMFFAYNDDHINLLRSINVNNAVITGSLKFSFLSHISYRKKRSAKLHIKINTRFRHVNNAEELNKEQMANRMIQGTYIDASEKNKYRAYWDKDQIVLNEFVKLIRLFGEQNIHKITIRVHPMENRNYYKKIVKKYKNISIEDKRLPLYKSLLEADYLIHDGCTTGLEAMFVGVPVLSLRPKCVGNYYNNFSNKYSLQHFYEAIKILDYLKENKHAIVPNNKIIRDIFPLRFIEEFNREIKNNTKKKITNNAKNENNKITNALKKYLKYYLCIIKKLINNKIQKNNTLKICYQKYPIYLKKITIIKRFNEIESMIGKNKHNIKIKYIDHNVIHITERK